MIEWKEGAVCYGADIQWFAVNGLPEDRSDLVDKVGGAVYSCELVIERVDFQLNEIRIGDYIEKSELDTEQKYNDVVEVFGLFGINVHKRDFKCLRSVNTLFIIDSDGEFIGTNKVDPDLVRKLTYNQIMAIGKLKRMMGKRSAVKSAPKTTTEVSADIKKVTANKYEREISDRQGNSATVDVYDVLKAFDVTCPATQHAVKKLLCSGIRGHKDLGTDLIEAKESIVRAIELNGL
jgi:hypothetical protein